MDLFEAQSTITLLCGVAMVVGVLGVIIPVLPGVLLCWASVLVWALFAGEGWGRWVAVAVATLIGLAGWLAKYAFPGKKLKAAGVPNRSLIVGGLLAIAGFFLIPIVGLVIGFVFGIWVAEQARLKDPKAGWRSTLHAVKAVGLAMLIELGAALAIAATWVTALTVT